MKNLLIHSTEYSKIFTTLSHAIYNLYLKVTIPLSKSYLRNIKYSQGFSMVESLVAIAVLLIAIVGPLTIAINSIQYSNVAKDKLQATYLAQEQLELMVARQHSIFIECYIGVPTDDGAGNTSNVTRSNCTSAKDATVINNSTAIERGVRPISVELEVKGQAFKEFYNELDANDCFSDGCYIDTNTLKIYNFINDSSTSPFNYNQSSSCELYTHDDTAAVKNEPLFLCNKESEAGWAKAKFTKQLIAKKIENGLEDSLLTDFKDGINNDASSRINKQDQILLTSAVTYTIFGIPRTVKLELLVSMLQ